MVNSLDKEKERIWEEYGLKFDDYSDLEDLIVNLESLADIWEDEYEKRTMN